MSRQRGFVATELALGIGVLLVPVAMLVLTVPSWSERQATARAIAREAGRTVAVAGWCDLDRARAVSNAMALNLGVEPGDVSVALEDCAPGRLPRGGVVTVSVTIQLPAVAIPGIANVAEWHWTARHTEPVDPYRSFD